MDQTAEPICFPLSLSQQRLWLVDQLQPHSATYHIPVCLRLTGPLAVEALKQSIDAVVARHEPLRTVFVVRDDAPFQFVKPSCVIPVQVRDISGTAVGELETRAYSLVRREIRAPFDLSRGPLVRAAVLQLGTEHYILIITMHHIVSDGWSAELFVRELTEYYRAFTSGRKPNPKPLRMQYSDFTILQRQLVASKTFEQQLAFWQGTLAGAPLLHSLPRDHPRPEEPTFAGATVTLRLDNKLVADLENFARCHRATVFMVLTAAFQVILSKYSGQHDVLIGIPLSGRTMAETESLIGLFVNTIVLRTSISGDPQFIEILRQVREDLLNAMSHQEVPFEQIVDDVGVPRRLAHNPLFQIMFATFRAAVQSREFGLLTATPYVVDGGTSRFDLSVNVIEDLDKAWWLQAEYSTELFECPRIANLLESYTILLSTILANGKLRLSDLSPGRGPVANGSSQIYSSMTVSKSGANPSIDQGTISLTRTERAATEPVSSKPIPIPLDYVESGILEIWQKHLGLSYMSLDADFFDLGGNSLLALAVTTKVNRRFGKRLPATALYRDSTIRELAARVRHQGYFQRSFFPLVEGGIKTPLFIAGHWCHLYRKLSRNLGPDHPVYLMDAYALQEERLFKQEPLFESIEDIAAHFINHVTSVQRSGPYFLAGQCEGGIVALEVGRQLQRQGHEIAALMELNTPVTGYFRRLAWHQRLGTAIRRGEFPQRVARHLMWRIRTLFAQTAAEKYLWDAVWELVHAYGTDKVFDGEIILFRAKELARMTEDVANGWDHVGRLRIIDVPGDHLGMFMNPDAQSIIRRVLEEAPLKTSRP
jgi:thioesterase domain-containing protein